MSINYFKCKIWKIFLKPFAENSALYVCSILPFEKIVRGSAKGKESTRLVHLF
jgi:hypothetical protein